MKFRIRTGRKTIRIMQHILFWVAYVMVYLFLTTRSGERYSDALFSMLLSIPYDILLVYFHLYFLIPKFLLKGKYFYFFLIFLGTATFTVIFERYYNFYIIYSLLKNQPLPASFRFWNFTSLFYFGMYIYSIVLLASAIKLLKQWLESQKRSLELENQTKTSELALLRMQINPHFLFNSLNNIHTLIGINAEKASDALVLLSDIMRYMLYDAAVDRVLLEKELLYLKSYIGIQRLRLARPDSIKLSVDGDSRGWQIAPMLFIPFVENAFKHFDKQDTLTGIEINIQITNELIRLRVLNAMKMDAGENKGVSGGIGLQNVERRLELLYCGKYSLQRQIRDGRHEVELEILKE